MKILSILPFPPRLDATHGGGKATASLLLKLAERHSLALFYLRRAHEPPVDPALRVSCELVEEIGITDSDRHQLHNRFRKLILLARGRPVWAIEVDAAAVAPTLAEVAARWRPDVVQIEYAVLIEAASLLPRSIPVVLVDHEPGTARTASELRLSSGSLRKKLVQRADLFAWRRFNRRLGLRASAVVVFTQHDRDSVADSVPESSLHVIPLGFDAGARALDAAGTEDTIVFIGSFAHQPNVDAALLLIREILPRVRLRRPNLTAYIVGDQPPSELLALAEANVIITGVVERVEPYLEQAAVAVAPLRMGGGMRVKVLETLAAGKALVATPLAVAGLSVQDGRHVLLAETPAAFADAVSRLLDDSAAREEMGRQARAWALEQLNWSAVAVRYERLYESLVLRESET